MKINWSAALTLMPKQLLSLDIFLTLYKTIQGGALIDAYSLDDVTYEKFENSEEVDNYLVDSIDIDIEFVVKSLNKSVAVVNGKAVEYVEGGTGGIAEIRVESDGYYSNLVKYEYNRPKFGKRGLGNNYVVKDYVAGSLGKHAQDICEAITQGFDPENWMDSATFLYYLNNSYAAGTQPSFNAYRNSGGWMRNSGIAYTGISAMSASFFKGVYKESPLKPGTLISPRHLIGANHFHAAVGETYVFKREDGSTVDVVVLERIDVGYDIVVSYIDTDLEALGFPVYKMMPTDWELNYATAMTTEEGLNEFQLGSLPCIRYTMHNIRDSFPTAGGRTSWQITAIENFGLTSLGGFHLVKRCTVNNLGLWSHERGSGQYEGGDSGCPMFIPIDFGSGAELVYLGAASAVPGHTGASGKIDAINIALNAMASLHADAIVYAVVEADLSAFTKFLPRA